MKGGGPSAPPIRTVELVDAAQGLNHAELDPRDAQEFLAAARRAASSTSGRSRPGAGDLRAREAARWRECTGEEWKDEAQLAYESSSRRERSRRASTGSSKPPPPPRLQTSLFTQLFEGQLLSCVTCCGCGSVSHTADPSSHSRSRCRTKHPLPRRRGARSSSGLGSSSSAKGEGGRRGPTRGRGHGDRRLRPAAPAANGGNGTAAAPANGRRPPRRRRPSGGGQAPKASRTTFSWLTSSWRNGGLRISGAPARRHLRQQQRRRRGASGDEQIWCFSLNDARRLLPVGGLAGDDSYR